MVINREDIVFPKAHGGDFDILAAVSGDHKGTGRNRTHENLQKQQESPGLIGYVELFYSRCTKRNVYVRNVRYWIEYLSGKRNLWSEPPQAFIEGSLFKLCYLTHHTYAHSQGCSQRFVCTRLA